MLERVRRWPIRARAVRPACDLCGAVEAYPLYHRGRGGEPVPNVVCAACGLVSIRPRPSQEDIGAQYLDGDFSVSARGAAAPSAAKVRASEKAALDRFAQWVRDIDPSPTGTAIEVGCGLGSFLRLVRDFGWNVRGVEPDPTYAGVGTERYGVPIEAALFEDVDVPSGSVDLFAAFHVLEHVPSPVGFLRSAREVLSPEGRVFIEVPSVERPYGGNLDRFFWSAHLTSFSAGTLAATARAAGLEPEIVRHHGDFLQLIARRGAPRAPVTPVDDPMNVVSSVRAKGAAYRALRTGVLKPATSAILDAGRTVAQAPVAAVAGGGLELLRRASSRPTFALSGPVPKPLVAGLACRGWASVSGDADFVLHALPVWDLDALADLANHLGPQDLLPAMHVAAEVSELDEAALKAVFAPLGLAGYVGVTSAELAERLRGLDLNIHHDVFTAVAEHDTDGLVRRVGIAWTGDSAGADAVSAEAFTREWGIDVLRIVPSDGAVFAQAVGLARRSDASARLHNAPTTGALDLAPSVRRCSVWVTDRDDVAAQCRALGRAVVRVGSLTAAAAAVDDAIERADVGEVPHTAAPVAAASEASIHRVDLALRTALHGG